MLKKWIQKAQQMQENRQQMFDNRLEEFDDPLAKTIDWGPLKGGGTNFKTHTLVSDTNHRLRYKASKAGLLFAGVFALFGIAFPGFMLYNNISSGAEIFDTTNLFLFGFGSLFAGVGFFMLNRFNTPITFDKNLGFFWRGKTEPEMYGNDNPDQCVRLSDIHALQIVAERVKSDKKSYFSFEINLITKDGERVNVIDHGSKQSIYNDAKTISEFLDVPVWDLNAGYR